MLGLAGLSAVAWGWQRYVHRERELSFAPIAGLPGWRRAEFGNVTAGSAADAVFLGLGDDAPTPVPPERLCETLYSEPAPGLLIAVFTDINCPNCRSLEAKLAARESRLNLNWLQLPLLGPGSVVAAQISVAASLFGDAPSAPPGALRGTGVAALLRFHANRAGVDLELLNDEFTQPAVNSMLETHAAAAKTLGVYGTPAMTIGKTLVMGDMSEERLDQLLSMDHPTCG